LAEVRETFHALAKVDPAAAMQAARQLTDPIERETALLALLTEWTRGELSPPGTRARAIVGFGLEAGLGMELARNPKLAALWAVELTDGQGRLALLSSAAANLVDTDPSGAFGLGQHLHEKEQRTFTETLLESWAQKDTQAALQWVNQLPDPTYRDLALQSIRQVAPVGIGAAVGVREGYPVILDLVPEGPAARNGQLEKGDRIVALAQEGSTPIDTRGLSLEAVVNMIRGAPGTRLQLQVEASGSAPGGPPRAVWISREQVTFKR
jgi:hypothetical protein